MDKRYKAAVIGCGNIGAKEENYSEKVRPGTHAGAFSMNKRTELAALVEVNKERWPELKKAFPAAEIFESAGEMFKKIKPDIVSIATPTDKHYEFVLLAAKNKCPAILCEKPLSYSLKEAEKMVKVCKESGSLLFTNHTRHFDPIIRKWSKKVKEGLLGEIYQGNVFYYNGFFNNGTHLIDLITMFLGEVEEVLGMENKSTTSNPNDPNLDGFIKFKSGALVSLQSLSKNYGFLGFRIFGGRGMLETLDLVYKFCFRKKIDNKNFKNFFELEEKGEIEGEPRGFMISVIAYIVDVLDKKAEPTSTGEEGLAVLKILDAFKKSAKSKKPVKIK